MKKFFTRLLATMLIAAPTLFTQAYGEDIIQSNYPPKNKNVSFTESNLPIVIISTDAVLSRTDRALAKVKRIMSIRKVKTSSAISPFLSNGAVQHLLEMTVLKPRSPSQSRRLRPEPPHLKMPRNRRSVFLVWVVTMIGACSLLGRIRATCAISLPW